MARKSRKETAAVAVQEADAACRAAIYVRLSVEDTHTHSVSIETQQMIIARYLEQYPEISVYDTYIDMYNRILIQCPPHGSVEKWLKQRLSADLNRLPKAFFFVS